MSTRLQFKVASEDWEFELIHQLNYKTFVEEIPQHERSATPRLVDKFHSENVYLICLMGRQLIGMMALRGKRPFSLDQKLPNLDSFLPAGRRPVEIRLLAVEKEFRSGQIFRGLTSLLWQYAGEHGFDLGIISGTTRQIKLYRHMGFIPFGPLVGKGDALFQPMFVTLESFEKTAEEFFTPEAKREFSFLPGPVAIHTWVRRAFEQPPVSHRSDLFLAEFQEVRENLCQLVGAKNSLILLGSGTLANDAVGAQLSLEETPGLILTNGEFGQRLKNHAERFGLTFDTLEVPWGEPFDVGAIRRFLERSQTTGWLWCVHGETSTGVLNPLGELKQVCADAKVKLCLDCISTIGVAPVNLEGVYLASGASGKGLASYPGLSLVFYNHDIRSSMRLPRYFDLGWYAKNQGIAFTQSSNLVRALGAALKRVDWPAKHAKVAETTHALRSRLRSLGFEIVSAEEDAAPGVITIALPPHLKSTDIGNRLQGAGLLLSYNSDYLRPRNWIQVCLMSDFTQESLEILVTELEKLCFPSQAKPAPQPPVGNGVGKK
jgi:aspartate aminotransferase-like enzyme